METDFQGFPGDELFPTNLLLSDIDEVMKNHLVGLENFNIEESWGEENNETENAADREDFQQIMSDWQQHLGSFHTTDSEEFSLSLDNNLDILNNYANCDLFGELESPILSRAIKYPEKKQNINIQPLGKTLSPSISKDSFLENLDSCNKSNISSQKFCGLVKTEPNVIRKVTLINGEKEILGKNIIGLHCLNKIKENPDENCQVTSTVINGKRYKVIIKPKSLRVKKLSEGKLKKTVIKKLNQCHLFAKTEPEEDPFISESCNDSFEVPIISGDILSSWDFAGLEFERNNQERSDIDILNKKNELGLEKKVPSVVCKTPILKKLQNKLPEKSNGEIDVVTVNEKVVEGHTLGSLLKNFEEKVTKLEINSYETNKEKHSEQPSDFSHKNIKNCLPREMINKIEALKRKKQCRIPIIEAIPTKKPAKISTRMQDAVATMNRNKLLKIVSAGDSVQLDHDYCSTFKTSVTKKEFNKSITSDINFVEKNPKKDSGMESGDVSDTSEGPNTPDCFHNLQSLRPIKNKVLEHRRVGDHSGVTKAAVGFFRASNAAAINANMGSSDSVKTKTVSNGNKALTNNSKNFNSKCDNSSTVSSDFIVKGTIDDHSHSEIEKIQKNENPVEQFVKSSPTQSERPKKKLKLEEYLSRRYLKEKEREKITNHRIEEKDSYNDVIESVQISEIGKSKVKETYCQNTQDKSRESQSLTDRNITEEENKNKNFWKSKSHRSSSGSSRERKRRSTSNSRSRWRRSSSKSSNGRRERRGKQRRSESRERKNRKGFWSGSLSRSPSRESSTSSDHSVHKNCRNSSTRYRRRSRSRSVSRGRSTFRNRVYNRRRFGSFYYNRNVNYRRSVTTIHRPELLPRL